MGAYENPAEIEGQFDLTQQSKALQGMLDKVTKSTITTINKIDEEHKLTAEKNKKIIEGAEEKAGQLQVILEKGKGKAKTGLNYDCYEEAIKEYKDIQKRIGFGAATPEDRRRSAQIIASVDGFATGAGDLNEQIGTYEKAKKFVPGSEGSINIQASSPIYIAALEAVMNNDGEKLQPSFDKDSNGRYDYTQRGYTLKVQEGDKIEEKFISATNLTKALDGNMPNGIVYNKTYVGKVDKIKTIAPYIFEQKDGVPTANIAPEYLESGIGETEQVGAGNQSGIYRQLFKTPDIKKIGDDETLKTNVKSLNGSSAATQNEAASLYYNQVKPTIARTAGNKEYEGQNPYLKYVNIKEMDNKNYYNETIPLDNTDLMTGLEHNMRAAILQSIPKKQAIGEKYFVSNEEIEVEKKLNTLINDEKLSKAHAAAKKGGKDYYFEINKKFEEAKKLNENTKEILYELPMPVGDKVITKTFLVKKGTDGKYNMQIIPQ
jgi:hypothetical protein